MIFFVKYNAWGSMWLFNKMVCGWMCNCDVGSIFRKWNKKTTMDDTVGQSSILGRTLIEEHKIKEEEMEQIIVLSARRAMFWIWTSINEWLFVCLKVIKLWIMHWIRVVSILLVLGRYPSKVINSLHSLKDHNNV